jgi:hypothetical protein
MNTKLRFIAIMLLSVLIFCSKKSNPTSNNNDPNNNRIFPLRVGNQWIYSNEDTISIDMSMKLINGKTSYHFIDDDDYTFGLYNLYYVGNILYGYEEEDHIYRLFNEDSLVATLQTARISVPAGVFDTYILPVGDESNPNAKYWVAKGMGVVRSLRGEETINLVKYSIK